MVEYRRYAKLEYRIQKTLRRRERCLRLSRFVAALVILPDKFERVFSKDAGEFSSLYAVLAIMQTEIWGQSFQWITDFPWPNGHHCYPNSLAILRHSELPTII